jgi:serine/threonine protein kinase
VCSVENIITKKTYAIKKISGAFPITNEEGKEIGIPKNYKKYGEKVYKIVQLRILREVKILIHLNKNEIQDSVVKLVDIILPKNYQSLSDVYLVFENFSTDLKKIIKNKFSKEDVKIILYQILLSMYYVHSADILHRDIKPANILL